MKLSIIIVSYNTCKILLECIQSIHNSVVDFEYEIIVVDNHSSDNSVESVQKQFPNVKIICNTENLLFAKANNIGAKEASGDYLLLLNSDTLLFDYSLRKLVSFLDNAPKSVACVGPIVLNKDLSIQSIGFAYPGLMERFVMSMNLNKITPNLLQKLFFPIGIPNLKDISTRECGWVSGSCMLLRHDIYEKIGGLNERLEFYGEEPELGWRLRNHGYKTYFTTDSKIIHLGGASTKSKTDECIRLKRYGVLQKETVGIAKSIWMSRIVLMSNYLKLMVSSNKQYFRDAIVYEQKVINYLKEHQ